MTSHQQFAASLGVDLLVSSVVGNGTDPNGDDIPWLSTVYSAPDLQVEDLIQPNVLGGAFEGNGSQWTVAGDGTFDIIASPSGQGMAGRLTTDTEVSITHLIDTPDAPFVLALDQLFTSVAGSAEVSLGGIALGEALAADTKGNLELPGLLVADPELLGQTDLELRITAFGGSTGQFVFDNVSIALAIPEPSTALLSTMLLLGVAGYRRRINR